MMSFRSIAAAMLTVVLSTTAMGQRLSVGDPAPNLEVDQVVWGEAFGVAPGFTYIIIFFSTTEGDAKPHFNALNKVRDKMAENLRIMAIADEASDSVNRYVRPMTHGMPITFAIDKNSRSNNTWAQASGKKERPLAFIVGGDGRLMYIGQVLDEKFFNVLSRVMRNRFDAKLDAEHWPKVEAARRARKKKNWGECIKRYDEVVAVNRSVFADVALEKLDLLLVEMDDAKQAYKYVDKLVEDYAGDSPFLCELARKLATDPSITDANRRLDVAQAVAQAAMDTARENFLPAALATMAVVQAQQKNYPRAIELQKDAWFRAPTANKKEYKRVLDSYQAALQRSQAKGGGPPTAGQQKAPE